MKGLFAMSGFALRITALVLASVVSVGSGTGSEERESPVARKNLYLGGDFDKWDWGSVDVGPAQAKDGDGAVWNFPIGRQGRIAVRLLLQPGCQGVSFALADRLIQPTDDEGEKKVLFVLPIAAGGRLPDGPALEPGRWYALALHWDLDKHCCQVLVDGRPAGLLPALSKSSPGACYLRLRCTAQTKDPAGMLVESVRAQVGSLRLS